LSSQPRSLAGWLTLRHSEDRGFHALEVAAVSEPVLSATEQARLQHLLETAAVVERAKEILMARFQCGPDVAFELLRGASQQSNVKVHVIAERLVGHASPPQRSGE
jgi:AmiR/NasT family two-component response regulator